jgi:hypothetical protein
MAVSQQKALAMAGVCTLLVLTFLAADVNAACSLAQVSQCTSAVTQGTAPSPACCTQVAGITDFQCFCTILKSQQNVPQNVINNAVHVPQKCGAQGANLRNKQCGAIFIP